MYKMDNKIFYSAGFYLVEGALRYEWQNERIIPPTLFSMSDCICDKFPQYWSYQESNVAIEKAMMVAEKYNIDWILLENLEKEIKKEDDKNFGFPNLFFNKNTAKAYYNKYFNKIKIIKLLEPGIELEYLQEIKLTAGNDNWGPIMKIKENTGVDQSGKIIGFDVVGYFCGWSDSFLCNRLEEDYKNKFGFELNEFGLFDDYDKAKIAATYNMSGEAKTEDILWIPWIIYEHSLEK